MSASTLNWTSERLNTCVVTTVADAVGPAEAVRMVDPVKPAENDVPPLLLTVAPVGIAIPLPVKDIKEIVELLVATAKSDPDPSLILALAGTVAVTLVLLPPLAAP